MKSNYILSVSLALVLATPASAWAQDAQAKVTAAAKLKAENNKYKMMEVKGVVVDEITKAPLAGIQIQTLNNSNYAAMTNEKGEFTIKVPQFATSLYVHAPQFLSQQVAINPNGVTRIQMLADKFKKMYDNGTSIVASSSFQPTSTTTTTVESDIENNLGADVRGVSRSGGPGYGSTLFIRGLNSLNANAQPLIVVDGVVRDMMQTRQAVHDGDYINLMLNINPADIEKVTVLKNGTALYGAKGGNGVILIETKRGHSMATRIDANIGVGVSLVPRLPDMMNASQYRLYASEMLGTYPEITDIIGDNTIKFLNTDQTKYYYNTYHNDTDWSKEVYRTALTQNYNINVQGGDNIGMYNLSLGYTDAQSTAKKNGFNRVNVRFNTDINVLKHLTTRFDMSFAKLNRNVFDNGAPEDFSIAPVSSPTLLGLIKAPILSPYTYNYVTGLKSQTLADADDFLTDIDEDLTLGNPTALLKNGDGVNKNRVETTNFQAVIAPKYQFTKSLSLQETFSYNLDRISQRYYRPKGGMPLFTIADIGTVQNLSMSSSTNMTSVMSDTRLQFTKHLGAHFLDVFGGFRFTSFAYDAATPKGQYASAANDKTPNVSNDMEYKQVTGADDTWKNLTWYANADYNYRNRYFAEFTLAMEASSRFGENASGLKLAGVKWAFFPSIQLGWVLSNESWFPKNNIVNYLRLNAGYDISGNDDINNNAARTSFSVRKYLYNSIGAQLDNIGNDKITYEKTGKFNVGLQSYLLSNRLGLNVDFYMNHTSNLLTLKSFSNPIAGINSYWSNGGSLDNKGVEVTVTGKPIVSKDWNLELGASLGHYKNEIKSLPDDKLIYVDGAQTAKGYTSSIYGTDNVATIVGKAAGVFYGYKTAGVFSTDAEAKAAGKNGYLYMLDNTGAKQYFKAGDMHFVDLNGDGEISEADKTVIGDPNPDVYGNIFANLNWKNFNLYLGFNYSLGNDIFNYERSILEGENNFYNQTVAVTNRWRYEGQVTDMPRLAFDDPMGNSRFSDRWIEDGSYLRLKTLRLTYQVPVHMSWLQGLSVWAEANNLFTITKYLGSDPEMSVSNSVLYQGIDAGNVALGRSFTFGLKINL